MKRYSFLFNLNSDFVNLCKLRGDLLDNKLLFHLVVMVQGSEVQGLKDSGCLPSEISGIEKNREAINPEPLKNPSIVIASDTRRKRLRCASEAISKHVDNPQDCHVALLLAMTRIDQK